MSKLKRVIAIAFLFMALGIGMELYLLDHYEDTQQLIPIICIAAALLGALIWFNRRDNASQAAFKWILFLTALSGVYGVYLHLQANYEFELEMKPALSGWELFTESLSGALPALAPASMIVLALIGYSYYLLLKHQE